MKELTCGEVYRLEECLAELAEHHNEVSAAFRGCYPKKPVRETLGLFGNDIRSGRSRIGVIDSEGRILGFCKISIDDKEGTIDYLIVLKEFRGKGYGDILLGWALDALGQSGVSRIEVRVVDGNDAIGFYEKYGFRICSHILRADPEMTDRRDDKAQQILKGEK